MPLLNDRCFDELLLSLESWNPGFLPSEHDYRDDLRGHLQAFPGASEAYRDLLRL